MKKVQVGENDTNDKAQEKINKLLEDLSKHYENMGKQLFKARQVEAKVDIGSSSLI